MGIHKTNYKKENGKVRKDKKFAKPADKNGAPENLGASNHK